MEFNPLNCISPIDGRYQQKAEVLSPFFSELGLIKYRVQVEIEYFIALCEIPLPQLSSFKSDSYKKIRAIYTDFNLHDAIQVKEIEKTTNHDIKAIEYFIKQQFDNLGFSAFKEFIHFGLTSQDINNTAVPLSLKEGIGSVYIPDLQLVINKIIDFSKAWKTVPMLARTHGQPASPTRLGKEFAVFAERLKIQLDMLKSLHFPAKFGGATGNFNAHHIAFPEIDWKFFANNFVNNSLGLNRSQTTTQIEHYDNLGAVFDNMKRINTILIDFNRDVWAYVSMNYFKQKIQKGEIGSSAMPHKVNPIDFENSEGNLGIANAIFEHLSAKLPISRLQRDLTDSTVLRNVGVPISHSLIAFKSTLKGLNKLLLNEKAIQHDLENNWIVIAEAIQTVLRRENYPAPYEKLKELTRTNQKITAETFSQFIDNLGITENLKLELKNITPFNYTGI